MADRAEFSIPFILTGFATVGAWFAFYPSPHQPVLHNLLAQCALAGRTMTYYAVLLLMPTERWMHQLSVGTLEHYGVWPILSGYLILFTAVVLMLRSMRRSPACAWFLAFVLTTLLPVCNLLPLPSLVIAPTAPAYPGWELQPCQAAHCIWNKQVSGTGQRA